MQLRWSVTVSASYRSESSGTAEESAARIDRRTILKKKEFFYLNFEKLSNNGSNTGFLSVYQPDISSISQPRGSAGSP
jgi:hypothetical protein